MKELTILDLNRTMVIKNPVRAVALMDMANLINGMYSKSSSHPFLIGDCALHKINLLKHGKRPRRNKP